MQIVLYFDRFTFSAMNHTKLTGTWRSYKAFCANGNVKRHSASSNLELCREQGGALTLKLHADRPLLTEVAAHEWEIKEEGLRYYLYLKSRRAFEVLTLDQHDLVLVDVVKSEKIFFALLAEWNGRLNPDQVASGHDVSITLWSKDLARLIKT